MMNIGYDECCKKLERVIQSIKREDTTDEIEDGVYKEGSFKTFLFYQTMKNKNGEKKLKKRNEWFVLEKRWVNR
jgi:hypothetical protein